MMYCVLYVHWFQDCILLVGTSINNHGLRLAGGYVGGPAIQQLGVVNPQGAFRQRWILDATPNIGFATCWLADQESVSSHFYDFRRW